jgi:hypothetical protein
MTTVDPTWSRPSGAPLDDPWLDGHRAAQVELLAEPLHPNALRLAAPQVVVRVIEVPVQVPHVGGVR